MNIPTLIAAALMLLTLFAHVFGGGPEFHVVYINSSLPDVPRAGASVFWHMITTILAAYVLALLYMAKHPNRPMAVLLSITQLGFAALFLYYGYTQLGTIWPMPQWTVFLLIPAITFWGQLRKD